MNLTRPNTGSAVTVSIFAALLSFLSLSVAGFGQDSSRLQAATIQVNVISVNPNPRDQSDLIVSVRVTIRAGKQAIVVPNCAAAHDLKNYFCLARLQRPNAVNPIGRWFESALDAEDRRRWRLDTISPGTEESFLFGFSASLFGVHAGEALKVAFEVWPDAKSTDNWKKATILTSPPFEFSQVKD
jgi:hypothetical protein